MNFDFFRKNIILKIFMKYKTYFIKEHVGCRLVDPVDKEIIGFHYGETHFAVGFIIYGYYYQNNEIFTKGIELLENFLLNSKKYQENPAYHWDFNNFALCVLIEFMEKEKKMSIPLSIRKLKEFIIKQSDSNHGTINWMPMRAFVNWNKYKWTSDKKYLGLVKKYLINVEKAKYTDGFYEDFLPKGKSFNFQYHIYTTALMHFLSKRMNGIKSQVEAINNCKQIIDTEGDINYLGRGCNQIFAWGPALYIFSSIKDNTNLDKILKYLDKNIYKALENYNLILNGNEYGTKAWWWDYHFSSVYYGHFVFWLMLTTLDFPKDLDQKVSYNKINKINDSGVHINASGNIFVCIFDGRNHYLSEKGPLVANISVSNLGSIFKGPLGPCGGQFGNKYSDLIMSVENYFGPIQKKIIMGNIVVKNLFPKSIESDIGYNTIHLKYDLGKKIKNVFFSVPILCDDKKIKINISVDNKIIPINFISEYMGPYGKTKKFQSLNVTGKIFDVIIKIKE